LTESRWQLFLMTNAANFVNVIMPTAGVGGMGSFWMEPGTANFPARGHGGGGVIYRV